MEYVASPLFKVWGVGAQILGEEDVPQWYGEDEVEDFLHSIDWSKANVICHNTHFDAYILTQYYGCVPAYYYDTAAMSRGRYPGQSARLAALAERLWPTSETMRKGEELVTAKGIRDLPPDIEESIAGYCIQDVELTRAAFERMVANYPESELDLINLTCRMFVDPVMMLDRERLTTYRDEVAKANEAAIEAAGIDRKVLSSNQQFSLYIKEELGIDPPTKRSPTTGKDIPALGKNDAGFKQMAAMYPQHKHIWEGRRVVKSRIAETRAQRFLDSANEQGLMPMPLRYYAAHTGRFGGTEKINVQNMPRGSELRKSLIAPPGHLVYVADLSNIEARMLAWIAREDGLLDSFRNGDDVYSNFASVIYDYPVNKHDHPTERFVGKTAVLGLGYGMGGDKFGATLRSGAAGPVIDIDDRKAKDIVDTYRGTYSGISQFWKKADSLLLDMQSDLAKGSVYGPLTVGKRKLFLPNGMALRYHELSGTTFHNGRVRENTYGGKLTENIVQALSRIIVTDALLRIEEYLNPIGGRVALTVHDEVVCVAPDDHPDKVMERIIELMCIPPSWAPNLPLDAEGGYAPEYSK